MGKTGEKKVHHFATSIKKKQPRQGLGENGGIKKGGLANAKALHSKGEGLIVHLSWGEMYQKNGFSDAKRRKPG